MNIPDFITLFNREYHIEQVDEIDERNRNRDGMVVYDKQVIYIKRDAHSQHQWFVFLHEVIHIIDAEYQLGLSEKQINGLARGVVELFCSMLDLKGGGRAFQKERQAETGTKEARAETPR